MEGRNEAQKEKPPRGGGVPRRAYRDGGRFTKGLSAALAWRGYKAVGGEFMLLLLPIIYYEAKRIILDFVADFVELYRRAED